MSGTTVAIDESQWLPFVTDITPMVSADAVAWVGGGGAMMISLEVDLATTPAIDWHAYVSPSATSLVFPSFPADLAIPAPASVSDWGTTQLEEVSVRGVELDALLAHIDIPGTSYPGGTTTPVFEGYATSQASYPP